MFGVDHSEEVDDEGNPLENLSIADMKLKSYDDEQWQYLVEEITFDEFDWNENAKDFSELEFEIDGKYIVKDFRDWLKRNFPKEYDILLTLVGCEFWGSGFESYVIVRV